MKIGFDAKRLYSNLSGLGNYSRTMLKNLSSIYPENEYYLYTTKIKASPETTSFLKNPKFKSHVSKSILKPL